MRDQPRIAVVIPCYRVREKVLGVVQSVIEQADFIFAVDDK